MTRKIFELVKRILSKDLGRATVESPENESEMTELEQTLRMTHDWAIDRMDTLYHQNRHADVAAIKIEFYEWMDPTIDNHDVVSMTNINSEI